MLCTMHSIQSQVSIDSSKIVKVLSFNILHGATTKGDFDLDAIARVIIATNPDFVALQEVDFKTNRAMQYDLATELGWRSKMVSILEVTSVIRSGDTIAFVGTHLDHLKDEKDRIAQAEKINDAFASNRYPTILAGDLNAIPGSTPIDILLEKWAASYDEKNPKPTFPSKNPIKKIDYVLFYPKSSWKVLDTSVIKDSIASDHCAYLVTLLLLEN